MSESPREYGDGESSRAYTIEEWEKTQKTGMVLEKAMYSDDWNFYEVSKNRYQVGYGGDSNVLEIEYQLNGELADRIRAAFAADEWDSVYLFEFQHEDWLSDVTNELVFVFRVVCGEHEKIFNHEQLNNLGLMIDWLDKMGV